MASRLAKAARFLVLTACAAGLLAQAGTRARAEALLLVEGESGKVLHAENAGYPWHPASITKLMTAYVTLQAVKTGRLKLDTLLTVSDNALAQSPSKMGFPAGTQVTVDNALKMLMVKSANDMAVVLAEGVSGSVEAFAGEMNRTSVRLGMVQSSWVNPNGLPEDGQITSARDMAILARAIYRDLPEYELYWHISAIKFGRRVMRNYNRLIDRYPGADGMKTGFICASGYNLVASATRNGRRLIAVVLGAPSGTSRAEVAAALLEKGFQGSTGLSWLTPSLGSVEAVQPVAATPPNLREEICGRHRGRHRTDHAEEEEGAGAAATATGDGTTATAYTAITPEFRMNMGERQSLLGPLVPSMEPIRVSVVPKKGAPDPEKIAEKPAKKKGGKKLAKKKSEPAEEATEQEEKKPKARVAAKHTKPAAEKKPAAAKSADEKPAARKKAAVAPDAADKPKPKAKPRKPKAAAAPAPAE